MSAVMGTDDYERALLVAQRQSALRDLHALQTRLDVVTRERDLLRLSNARLTRHVLQLTRRVYEMRATAARAAPRVFDAFARLVLDDLAARD